MGKKDEKSDKPEPPKKALTAFFLYKQDVFAETKKENPDAKVTDLTRIISEKWKNVDKETRAEYDKRHEEAKQKYEKEVKEYEAKYGPIPKTKRKKGKGSDDEGSDDGEDDSKKKNKKTKTSKKK